MRRDYFTIDVRGVDWIDDHSNPEQPGLIIDFEGPASLLQERLTGFSTGILDESAIDVSFRFQSEEDDPHAEGVLSVTDRVIGDYVLELNASAEDVLAFIKAAREFAKRTAEDGTKYQIDIRIDDDPIVTYEKRTFLIYNRDGNLLRKQSLIPSGVEL